MTFYFSFDSFACHFHEIVTVLYSVFSFFIRSIYMMREETLIKDEPTETPVTRSSLDQSSVGSIKDFQLVKEKTIISESPPRDPDKLEQKRFSKVILQKYCTPSKYEQHGYGSPRDSFKTMVREPTITEMLQRSNSSPEIKINARPSQVMGVHSHQQKQEFCNTLGSSACRICIEGTNRQIAEEIERDSFPYLECSASTLVAPSLAMMMIRPLGTSHNSRTNSRLSRNSVCSGSIHTSRSVQGSRANRRTGMARESDDDDHDDDDVLLPPVWRERRSHNRSSAVHERAAAVRQIKANNVKTYRDKTIIDMRLFAGGHSRETSGHSSVRTISANTRA